MGNNISLKFSIPDRVIEYAEKICGAVQNITPFEGMGSGYASKIIGNKTLLIVKGSRTSTEKSFYENLAPTINAAGISTPYFYFAAVEDEITWVGIEYIERALPSSRWHDDVEVIKTIAKLHSIDISLNSKFRPFQYSWPVSFIETAVNMFPLKKQDSLRLKLNSIRENFIQILEPRHFVSGDPNGTNWGLRNDDTLVLFDWERAGFATEAIDLMSVAYGQLEDNKFHRIAEIYLTFSSLKLSINELKQAIKAGRVYIITELLHGFSNRTNNVPPKVIEKIIDTFPSWVHHHF